MTQSAKVQSSKKVSSPVAPVAPVDVIKPEKSDIRFFLSAKDLSNNLFVDLEKTGEDKLSNAQKAYELAQWVSKAMLKPKDIYAFFDTIESAINMLPAGDVKIPVFSKKMGKVDHKDRNYRDIAKSNLKTAWKNAAKTSEGFKNTELHFKLSEPTFKPVAGKPEKTLKDKISDLLGDKIDSEGMFVIMENIDIECRRVAKMIELGNKEREESRLDDSIRENYRNLLTLGVDSVKAVARTAAYMDVSSERVELAIAK